MKDWETMKKRGFKCIKVKFNPADLEEEFGDMAQTAHLFEG
jgi:hypothetical protein